MFLILILTSVFLTGMIIISRKPEVKIVLAVLRSSLFRKLAKEMIVSTLPTKASLTRRLVALVPSFPRRPRSSIEQVGDNLFDLRFSDGSDKQWLYTFRAPTQPTLTLVIDSEDNDITESLLEVAGPRGDFFGRESEILEEGTEILFRSLGEMIEDDLD